MGMFTQNTARQVMYWIRKAPSDGPITAAMPNPASGSALPPFDVARPAPSLAR